MAECFEHNRGFKVLSGFLLGPQLESAVFRNGQHVRVQVANPLWMAGREAVLNRFDPFGD